MEMCLEVFWYAEFLEFPWLLNLIVETQAKIELKNCFSRNYLFQPTKTSFLQEYCDWNEAVDVE